MPKVPWLERETPLAAMLPSGALRVRLCASEPCRVHLLLLPRWASPPTMSTRGLVQRTPTAAQLVLGLSHAGKPAIAKVAVTLMRGYDEFDLEVSAVPRGAPGDLRAFADGELCLFAVVEDAALTAAADDGPLGPLRSPDARSISVRPRYGRVVGPVAVECDAPIGGGADNGGDDASVSAMSRLRRVGGGARAAPPASTRVVYAHQPAADGSCAGAPVRPYVEGMEARLALEAFEREAAAQLAELRAQHALMLEALEAAAAHLAADTTASAAEHVALLSCLRATTDALLRCDADNLAEEARVRKRAERDAAPAKRSRRRCASHAPASEGGPASERRSDGAFDAEPTRDGGGDGAPAAADAAPAAADSAAAPGSHGLLSAPSNEVVDSGAVSDLRAVAGACSPLPVRAAPAHAATHTPAAETSRAEVDEQPMPATVREAARALAERAARPSVRRSQ